MAHAEFKRIVPDADTAVLFIHGIVGTPDHFRVLIPMEQLVPPEWSVYNVLLPGHGGTVEDFAGSTMDAWRDYAKSAFAELARQHKRIILVAHSMGTLFALQLALEFPRQIPFLFLLGVPLRPGVRLGMMRDCLGMVFGMLKPDHVLWRAAGVTTTRRIWKYVKWIPRFLELFREIRQTERIMGGLTVPCVTYQSQRDELVTNFTRKVLERSGVMEVHNLLHSTHFFYAPEDMRTVLDDFAKKVKEISHD